MTERKLRLLHITAGAAGMYCGTCMRDNALAFALKARGHDVTLVPFYTPTLTDEENVSQDKIFFGGISVYLEQHVPFFRHTPWLVDKLWDSRFALKLASKSAISVDAADLGDMTISMLEGEQGNQKKEIQKLIRWLRDQPRPDIINLPYALLIGLAAPLKEALGCPIVCTLQGEDLFLEGLTEPYRTRSLDLIRSKIGHVDAFIAVSKYYADFMPGYLGLDPELVHIAPIGINLEGHSVEHPKPDVFTVGYFARVAPEKGLHTLCEAYAIFREQARGLPAKLEAAGYLPHEHRRYLSGIENQMKEWGLGGEFTYRGALDREEKIDFLQSLSVFSVPTPYREPKGIFLLEAMANGVPVVQPRHGAFPEIIEQTGGGILVEPDDPKSLADGLMRIFEDTHRAEGMGRMGAEGVRRHYTVEIMAERTVEAYNRIIAAQTLEPALPAGI
jgi:glycosyltransferase involved in cell wall biosynthesis